MGFLNASQMSLFSAAVLMIIPSLMVLVSTLAAVRVNRILNLVTSIIYIFVNIGNLIGESWGYYLLFGILEIGVVILIFILSLSEEQITAILEGKRVLAPPKEIQEVENALGVYERLEEWDPSSLNDLLKAHQVMTSDLIKESGRFRSSGVGVMKGQDVVHMAPPASLVPTLINQLLLWVKESKDHPLIVSSIFHYEFEYIHPFSDGNGRMGRLWQTLILSRWYPLFSWLPVEKHGLQTSETVLWGHRSQYPECGYGHFY